MGDPATWALLAGQLGGPLLGSMFAPDPQEAQSFAGENPDGSLFEHDPRRLANESRNLNNQVLGSLMDRASQPITLRSSFVQQPGAYCLKQDERILTASLEWVPCGDIREGASILAFDEQAKVGGRSWQPASVTMSRPTKARCVRVVLDSGESVVTTEDHPWLAECDNNNDVATKRPWIRSDQLTRPRVNRLGYRVLRVAIPWKAESGFDAGWLSGIWDGEGCISHARNNWKASVSQRPGLVSDRFCEQMRRLGFNVHVRTRQHSTNPNPVSGIGFKGDFSELLAMLGRLRPVRIIENFVRGIAQRRLVANGRYRVVAVESAGYRDIQSISTTSGTYIGEGFLHHNTGGGLPFPIGLVAQDPALADPSLLSIPGLDFSKLAISDGNSTGTPPPTRRDEGPKQFPGPRDDDASGRLSGPQGLGGSGTGPQRVPLSTGERGRDLVATGPDARITGASGDDLDQATGAVDLLLRALEEGI